MGNATRILELAAVWSDRAAVMRTYGADAQAATIEACAAELREAVREWQQEELTLEQAAAESGYSYSTLQQKVAGGEIPNVGHKGRPRVRRNDLPRKAPGQGPTFDGGEPDLAGEILAAMA